VAQAPIVKLLVTSIFHLKKCKVEKPEECQGCIEAATRLSAALSEGMETAEYLRKLAGQFGNFMRQGAQVPPGAVP
jgi:hypothetical protein